MFTIYKKVAPGKKRICKFRHCSKIDLDRAMHTSETIYNFYLCNYFSIDKKELIE